MGIEDLLKEDKRLVEMHSSLQRDYQVLKRKIPEAVSNDFGKYLKKNISDEEKISKWKVEYFADLDDPRKEVRIIITEFGGKSIYYDEADHLWLGETQISEPERVLSQIEVAKGFNSTYPLKVRVEICHLP